MINLAIDSICEKTKVGFVFAYPNGLDQALSKMQVGSLGMNFQNLLYRLNRKHPNVFPSTTKTAYSIINVYPKAIVEESACDLTIIDQSDNLERIQNLIQDLDIIVCFGGKAQYIVNKISRHYDAQFKIIKAPNLMWTNTTKRAKYNMRSALTDYRTVDVFNEIIQQIK